MIIVDVLSQVLAGAGLAVSTGVQGRPTMPLGWFSALIAKYGATIAGLVIGTAAKYALALIDDRPLSKRGIVADILLLGILGLIAVTIADAAGRVLGVDVSENVRILTGSLAAVASDRLVRLYLEHFLRRVRDELGDVAPTPAPLDPS
jgi:hypothetical protein